MTAPGFIPQIVANALQDRRLSKPGKLVLTYLWTVLDLAEYRTTKAWWVAQKLSLARSTVSDALGELERLGYLVRGRTLEHNIASYRLETALRSRHYAPVKGANSADVTAAT